MKTNPNKANFETEVRKQKTEDSLSDVAMAKTEGQITDDRRWKTKLKNVDFAR